MVAIILLSLLGFVLVMLIIMTYYLRSVATQFDVDDEAGLGVEKKKTGISSSQTFVYTAIILVSVAMVAALYIFRDNKSLHHVWPINYLPVHHEHYWYG